MNRLTENVSGNVILFKTIAFLLPHLSAYLLESKQGKKYDRNAAPAS